MRRAAQNLNLSDTSLPSLIAESMLMIADNKGEMKKTAKKIEKLYAEICATFPPKLMEAVQTEIRTVTDARKSELQREFENPENNAVSSLQDRQNNITRAMGVMQRIYNETFLEKLEAPSKAERERGPRRLHGGHSRKGGIGSRGRWK